METRKKEVYFDKYCPKCVEKDTPETKEPCNECLTNPSNDFSHKPIKWREK